MRCRQLLSRAFLLFSCVAGVSACHDCEKLVERMCTDLGPEDCTYWKAHGWDAQLIPQGRGVNKACGTMMSDAVYQPLIKAQKDMVAAYRKVDATKAKAQ